MMLVTLLTSPCVGGLCFFPVWLKDLGTSGDLWGHHRREGISLETLQSSSSVEILYSNYSYGKKNAVDLHVLMWKTVHDILLSETTCRTFCVSRIRSIHSDLIY